jgi:hypothetical protein
MNNAYNPYLWPPKCRLAFYKRQTKLVTVKRDRELDISDACMWWWPRRITATMYFGIATKSTQWKLWNEEALKRIEWHINYDFTFEGDTVRITRLGKKGSSCSKEFLWKLEINHA